MLIGVVNILADKGISTIVIAIIDMLRVNFNDSNCDMTKSAS